MWPWPWSISKKAMKNHPRVIDKLPILLPCLGGLGIVGAGLWNMLPCLFDPMPVFARVFLAVFLVLWCGFGLMVVYILLCALETVRLEGEQLLLCLGPLVLRRVEAGQIRSVSLAAAYDRAHRAPMYSILVLSKATVPELNKKGAKLLKSIPRISYMAGAGVSPHGPNAGARAYLYENFPFQALWLEYSEEALRDLRSHLPRAVYLTDPANR